MYRYIERETETSSTNDIPIYIYVYMYKYRRFGGIETNWPPPWDREIDSDFDSDSSVRADEAKLCGCARETCVS